MTTLRTVSISVRGKVQGVWFRASAKAIAERLSITGLVANRSDGSVYIEAAGYPEAIEEFIAWCKKGPEFARVDHIEVDDIARPPFSSFEIQR